MVLDLVYVLLLITCTAAFSAVLGLSWLSKRQAERLEKPFASDPAFSSTHNPGALLTAGLKKEKASA